MSQSIKISKYGKRFNKFGNKFYLSASPLKNCSSLEKWWNVFFFHYIFTFQVLFSNSAYKIFPSSFCNVFFFRSLLRVSANFMTFYEFLWILWCFWKFWDNSKLFQVSRKLCQCYLNFICFWSFWLGEFSF